MKSIKKSVNSTLNIKKSSFINYLYPVATVKEVTELLSYLRDVYPDASHHCFAYIIGYNQQIQKFSDDGEPSSTAGIPMINVLKKNDLTNILSVTLRYFGGIKLGASGLIRAYSKSTANSLTNVTFTYLKHFEQFSCDIPFHYVGKIENYLRQNTELLNVTYDSSVHFTCEVLADDFKTVKQVIIDGTSGDGKITSTETIDRYV
ncbi:MAG: YigZ family protein [Candidatus Izimaplasma sp.]|nr:YigZ family protein [Candidatus Izimaplasma bacterium]